MEEDPYAKVMDKIKRRRSATRRGEAGASAAQRTANSRPQPRCTPHHELRRQPAPAQEDSELETLLLVREFTETGSTDALDRIDSPAFTRSLLKEPLDFPLKLKIVAYLLSRNQINDITVGEGQVAFDTPLPETPLADTPSTPPRRLNIKATGLTTLAAILEGCRETVVLGLSAGKEEIYAYINTRLSARECCALAPDVESLVLAIRGCASFNFRMFIAIYLKIQCAFLSRAFVSVFISKGIAGLREAEKDVVVLAKAREMYRLFKRGGDYRVLRAAQKLLACRRSRAFLDARAKIYLYVRDFYSAMECSRGTPSEYAAMALVDRDVAVERLRKKLDIGGQTRGPPEAPYLMLLAELLEESRACPLAVYRAGIERGMPGALLGLMRYLKRTSPAEACDFWASLPATQRASDDHVAFEAYIALRRCGRDYMSFLYEIRKTHNTPLIAQEIAYFEHRGAGQLRDDRYTHLFLFKEILRRACNRDGCCADCRKRYSNMLENVHRFRENGDFLLLHFFVNRDLEIKKVADHFEPEGGFYWPRLSRIMDFESKMNAGLEMAILDFAETGSPADPSLPPPAAIRIGPGTGAAHAG